MREKRTGLKEKSMSKARTADPLDTKFTLEAMQGKGVRGKYLTKVAKGSNVVKLDPEIARAFPSAEAVNAALASVIEISKLTSKPRRTVRRKAA